MKTIICSTVLVAVLAGCSTTPKQPEKMSDKELCSRYMQTGLTIEHRAVYEAELQKRGVSCMAP